MEGWKAVNNISHYFLDDRVAPCQRLRSLCGQVEIPVDEANELIAEPLTPDHRCLSKLEGLRIAEHHKRRSLFTRI